MKLSWNENTTIAFFWKNTVNFYIIEFVLVGGKTIQFIVFLINIIPNSVVNFDKNILYHLNYESVLICSFYIPQWI